MIKEDFIQLLKPPFYVTFTVIWLLYLGNMITYSQFVWHDDVYLKGSNNATEQTINTFRTIDSIRYFFSPLILFLSIAWSSLFLYGGLLTLKIKTNLQVLLKINLLCQFFIILGEIFNTFYFLVVSVTDNRETLENFYLFSLLMFVKDRELIDLYKPILKNINLFQVLYILALSGFLRYVFNLKSRQTFVIILLAYILPIVTFYLTFILIKM